MTIIRKPIALMLLRVSLGVVFVWFGGLKIIGLSPVAPIIHATYRWFPGPGFIVFLGIWEVLIGLGFLLNKFIKAAVALMWLQMAGIFGCLVLVPSLFFAHGNPFVLTTYGEFIIKNIVLLAGSLVVLTHE
jgi:uncharacterized membrane protein YkgB